MGFRFRKRLKLLPGVWVNLSKKGGSLSVGGHGLTTNISRRGVRETIGLPGSGVSYTTRPVRLGHSRKVSDRHEHRGAVRRPTGRRVIPAVSIAQALLGLAVVLVVLWLLAHH